nr:hypothetical protein [Tanacetum cinerariifolium]
VETRRARCSLNRSPVNTNVFTRLDEKEKYIFTWLGGKEKDVFSRLGSERHRYAGAQKHASAGKATGDLDLRRMEARNLVRSYVTCSSKPQKTHSS